VSRSRHLLPPLSRRTLWPLGLAGWLLAASAGAQTTTDGGGRRFAFVPTFDASLTYSDLKRDVGDSGTDFVSQIRPGFQFSQNSGRVRTSVGYSLNAVNHSRSGLGSELQNSLRASLSADLVENFAFLNGSASVSQSSLDAFGLQSDPNSTQVNSNRAEVATVALSPQLRGRLGSFATYDARLDAGATNTRRSKAGDSTSYGASLGINSASTGAMLGWGLQAGTQRTEFRVGRATTSDRASLSLFFRPDPELLVSLRAGKESSDALETQSTSYNTYGGAISWTPNERTLASFDTERRYFGQSRRFTLQHRLPSSSLRLTSSRDVTGGANPNGVGNPVTLYQLLDALLVSRFPDPVERDAEVRVLLQGRDPNTIVAGGFVNSRLSVQTRTDLGWTYTGLRLTLGLQAFALQSSALQEGGVAPADQAVRQRSYSASASYRLTPTAGVSLTGARLMTRGAVGGAATDLKSLTLGLNEQLSRLASGSLSARYSVFNSPTEPYRETALTAALSLRF
jgi:uncharacterized protein (PEP-CTERM system associated)